MKNIAVGVLVSVMMFSVSAVSAMEPMMRQESKVQGQKAPDFTLKDTDGNKYSFSKARDGKKAILFFWATWCPHCRTQIKDLQSTHQAIAEQNIELVLIDLGEGERQVRSYLKQNSVTLPILLDEDGSVGEEYGVFGLPTFIFVNEAGNVASVAHDLPDDFEEFFK